MRTLIFALLLGGTSFSAAAQNNARPQLLKLNLPSLAVKNVSVQYEAPLTRKISAALGFRFMPTTGLPFQNAIASLSDADADARTTIEGSRLRNIAFTPELRFYLGKGRGQGFYFAPYYRFSRFASDYVPVQYTSSLLNQQRRVVVSGALSAHSGGLLMGAQWLLGKHLVLDWWIAGAHVGGSRGRFDGRPNQPLTPVEQQQVRDNLEAVDLPFLSKRVSVTANNVGVDVNGGFGGVRTGLAVGVRW